MQIMTFKEFNNTIEKLKENNKTNKSNVMMYLIIPFLNRLGYDVYNLDDVDLNIEEGNVLIKNNTDLNILVTLDKDLTKLNSLELNDDAIKIYVNMGIKKNKIRLYYKVLEKWENIVEISLNEENAEDYAQKFTKRISKEQVNKEYTEKGNRFLTENVLDEKLNKDEWNNDFLMYGLLKELEEPTDDFVKVLSKRLTKEYTSQEPEDVQKKLNGVKTEGIVDIIQRLVNKRLISLDKKDITEENEDNIEEEEQEITEDEIDENVDNNEEESEYEVDIDNDSKDENRETEYEEEVDVSNLSDDEADIGGFLEETSEESENKDKEENNDKDEEESKSKGFEKDEDKEEDNMVDVDKTDEDDENNNDDDEDGLSLQEQLNKK